ncbi:hypothetical protein BpHYR1_022539 [Brachionus plicatilis]|uniref:Uncharacterized protein n=1 Tax=Brachionus plicatilis TaxID=10195 RepID=A0A3M7QM32_BRAPC|nr:hypothetical protein BpHYR1_022539 [Brachionus plicatilis]
MESHGNYRRGEDELESNYSYGSGDDDPILTATITFDVTVDPNGQVISASEGQVIAEGVQRSVDGRGLNQLHHDPLPMVESDRHQNDDEGAESDDSASTSTDSLMERTKKYMSEEAGIIILKRTNQAAKNFNINLDFDVENSLSENALNAQGNNFNINFDFENSPQVGETKEPPQAWVDIDLMITSSATNSKIEERQSNETFEEIKNALRNRASNDAQYWRSLNQSDSNEVQIEPSLIENDATRESLNRSELKDESPGRFGNLKIWQIIV